MITKYILIVEERLCECCNAVYRSPSPHLRVLLTNRQGDTRTISLQSLRDVMLQIKVDMPQERVMPTLPRSHQYVKIEVPYCEACFAEVGEAQSEMFTSMRPKTAREVLVEMDYSEVLTAKFGRIPNQEEIDTFRLTEGMDALLTANAKRTRKSGSPTPRKPTAEPIAFDLGAMLNQFGGK